MVYLFQAGVPFSTENGKETAFTKVYSKNINTNLQKIVMKYTKEIPITPNNTPSTPTKTPSTPNKSPIMPKKAPSSPNKKRCFVARQFLSQIYAFFGVPFRGLKNMVAYQK